MSRRRAGVRRDVGQQRFLDGAVIAVAVPEDHVGKLVEHELLAVQRGVAAGVEHEVVGVGGEQGRAEAVVGVEVCEFDDAEPAVPPVLDGVAEVVEGEGVAELKARDGRRYGLFDIHGSPLVCGEQRPVSAPCRAVPVSARACVSFPRPGTW